MSKPKLIIIVGPTASGKSALGVFLAKRLRGEIISADSRQVYKGLDIGTGKVTKKEMQDVSHHLLDVASPLGRRTSTGEAKKQFSANDFVKHATKALKKIDVPIIVGGTGFYIDALLGRVVLPQVPPNPTLRKKLARKNAPELYRMLLKKDPARAKNIDKHNPVRLIRAIEVAQYLRSQPARSEGKTWPSGPERPRVSSLAKPYKVLWLGINPDSKILKENIHARLLARMKKGMVAEARRLHARGLSFKHMEELGLEYRFLSRFLQKKITEKQLVEELERAIWQYAKRQRTWFKRNKNIHWIKNQTEALRLAKKFLSS